MACRLWEISENLHRAELSELERSRLRSEWVEIIKPVQLEQVYGGRGNKAGESEAARQLGIDRVSLHRSLKVASLSPEAQDAARSTGLDDNRSALLDAVSDHGRRAGCLALFCPHCLQDEVAWLLGFLVVGHF